MDSLEQVIFPNCIWNNIHWNFDGIFLIRTSDNFVAFIWATHKSWYRSLHDAMPVWDLWLALRHVQVHAVSFFLMEADHCWKQTHMFHVYCNTNNTNTLINLDYIYIQTTSMWMNYSVNGHAGPRRPNKAWWEGLALSASPHSPWVDVSSHPQRGPPGTPGPIRGDNYGGTGTHYIYSQNGGLTGR